MTEEFADWSWRPRYCGGEFDFGDEADFRRGVDLFVEMIRKRYTPRPGLHAGDCPAALRHSLRCSTGFKAKIDVAPIAEEEVRAAGWDRSDYAPW